MEKLPQLTWPLFKRFTPKDELPAIPKVFAEGGGCTILDLLQDESIRENDKIWFATGKPGIVSYSTAIAFASRCLGRASRAKEKLERPIQNKGMPDFRYMIYNMIEGLYLTCLTGLTYEKIIRPMISDFKVDGSEKADTDSAWLAKRCSYTSLLLATNEEEEIKKQVSDLIQIITSELEPDKEKTDASPRSSASV